MNWLYFPPKTNTPWARVLRNVVNHGIVWRSARDGHRRLAQNVDRLRVGDDLFVAFRTSRQPSVFLRGRIAEPRTPVEPGLVVDRVSGAAASELQAAGYRTTDLGDVEFIRLEDLQESFFALEHRYSGSACLRELMFSDMTLKVFAQPLPPRPSMERVSASWFRQGRVPGTTTAQDDDALRVPPFVLPRTNARRCFDAYLMLGWSASDSLASAGFTLWLAAGEWSADGFCETVLERHATRLQAIERTGSLLDRWLGQDKRVLFGIDAPLGFPTGFAQGLGLEGPSPWRALHRHFAEALTDDADNGHNALEVVARCNRRFDRSSPGPFWGVSPDRARRSLTSDRVGRFVFPYGGVQEWRAADRRTPPQLVIRSVWGVGTGRSGGLRAMLAMTHLASLRSRFGERLRLWPLESGWCAPTRASVWVTELRPPLVLVLDWEQDYFWHRDRTLIRGCLRRAARRDATGDLAAFLDRPAGLDEGEAAAVEGEEGWPLFLR